MSRWRVVTAASFDKAVKRLDRPVARRVVEYLEALAELEDPRYRGKGLTGDLAGHWRYRVGDYRVLVRITESEMVLTGYRAALVERMARDVEHLEALNRKIGFYEDVLAAQDATPEDVTGARASVG